MTTTDAQRLQIARIVAEDCLEAATQMGADLLYRAPETINPQALCDGAIGMLTGVLWALDGELDPELLGVTDKAAERIRALAEGGAEG